MCSDVRPLTSFGRVSTKEVACMTDSVELLHSVPTELPPSVLAELPPSVLAELPPPPPEPTRTKNCAVM